MTTLQNELDELKATKFGGYMQHDELQIEQASKNMESGRIPTVGDKAIPFTLPSDEGMEVSLTELLKTGPVILSFFRGGWCDYCQLELKALQRSASEFEKFQASLVGISPSTITIQSITRDNIKLTYTLLSDMGNSVAAKYGLKFSLTDEIISIFEGFGIMTEELHGQEGKEAHNLPIPATFVISPGHDIVYAFADADHTKRAEPSEIIASLMSII